MLLQYFLAKYFPYDICINYFVSISMRFFSMRFFDIWFSGCTWEPNMRVKLGFTYLC
jgi:hypothetical protein